MSSLIANQADIERAQQALLSSGRKLSVSACGAGAGITKLLWAIPGASAFLVETLFPYHRGAIQELIGRDLKSFASREAAVALASATYSRAQEALLSSGEQIGPDSIITVGGTGTVATARERRGSDRLHLAIRSGMSLSVGSFDLQKGYMDRAWQGELCDLLIFNALLSAAGIEQVPLPDCKITSTHIVKEGESYLVRLEPVSPPELSGLQAPRLIDPDGSVSDVTEPLDGNQNLILPGSFDPLHYGHEHMARFAEAITGRRVIFEITANNVDKVALQIEQLAKRTLQFRGRWPVIVTPGLSRFVEKARVYGCDFAVGADTAKRICDPKFYGSQQALDAAMQELRATGRIFHVASRVDPADGTLVGVSEAVPEPYRDLFAALPGRWDVSSRLIRKIKMRK